VSVINLLTQTFAAIALVFGLVAMLSPIPFGLPVVVVALAVLVSTNPRLADRIRRWRRNHPGFDEKVRGVEDALPDALAEPLRRTDP